jgi:hypothetical protein
MQSVYDVYHHSYILLQDVLRLPHSCFHEWFHGQKLVAGNTVAHIYDTANRQTGQMEVTSPPSVYNGGINAWDLSCDCGLDHEMIRVRGCVLVAVYASHPVLLNVTVYYKNPSKTTLKLNRQGRKMIPTRNRTRTQTEKSWMQLMMTWQETTHAYMHFISNC